MTRTATLRRRVREYPFFFVILAGYTVWVLTALTVITHEHAATHGAAATAVMAVLWALLGVVSFYLGTRGVEIAVDEPATDTSSEPSAEKTIPWHDDDCYCYGCKANRPDDYSPAQARGGELEIVDE